MMQGSQIKSLAVILSQFFADNLNLFYLEGPSFVNVTLVKNIK